MKPCPDHCEGKLVSKVVQMVQGRWVPAAPLLPTVPSDEFRALQVLDCYEGPLKSDFKN